MALGRHSFSLQVLANSDVKLFVNGKELKPKKIYDNLPPYNTSITIGKPLLDSEECIEKISYEDLKGMGLMISSRKAKLKFREGQRVEYFITILSPVGDVGRIPPFHQLLYDRVNKRVRLVGPNSRNVWVRLGGVSRPPRQNNPNPLHPKHLDFYKEEALARALKDLYPYPVEESLTINIEELPIMISESGELICIPITTDSPVIGIFGETGTGKTMLLHGIVDRSYWKLGRKIIILNDTTQETTTWTTPWNENSKFIPLLNKIGEPTLPLPLVFLTLNTNTLKEVPMEHEECGFKFSISFKEAILNYENFFEGIPGWSLKNSGKYLRKLIYDEEGNILLSGLANVKDFYEIKEKIESLDIEIQGVKDFLSNVFRDLYTSQIFDITNNIESKWIVKFRNGITKEYNPWIAATIANLIPSIQNFDSRRKIYHSAILNYILNDIFLTQTEDPFFRKNEFEILIAVDEVGRLLKNQTFLETFDNVIAEHRMSRLPIVYATQYVEDIPESITINTQYNFFFRQRAKGATTITQNFPMLKTNQKQLKKLKKFECILAATEALVSYDINGNRKAFLGTETEPIRGYILPSLSQHKPPKKI